MLFWEPFEVSVCGLFHIKVSSGFILMSISFLQCRSYVRGCLKWGGSIGSLNFSFTIQLFTFLSVFPLTWAMGFTSFLWNNFTENHNSLSLKNYNQYFELRITPGVRALFYLINNKQFYKIHWRWIKPFYKRQGDMEGRKNVNRCPLHKLECQYGRYKSYI